MEIRRGPYFDAVVFGIITRCANNAFWILELQQQLRNRSLSTRVVLAAATLLLGACSHTAIEPETRAPTIPPAWQRGGDAGAPTANWLKDFGNAELTSLVEEAVANNYSLHQERARLYRAEQSVVLTRANRFPTLNLTLDGQRRGADGSTIS